MPELTRVETRIYDNDYIITGDATEDYISRVASYVDSRMRELSRTFPDASSIKLAILTAVNISDELFQLKENPQKKRLKIIRLEKSIEKLEERMNKSKASLDKFKKKVSDMNEDNKLFEKAWF
jgi:cell division protein ZapA